MMLQVKVSLLMATLLLLVSVVNANVQVNENLRAELIAMIQEDQNARQKLINAGLQDQELIKKVIQIDSRNTARLKEIIKEHGWPTKSLVGEDGTAYAFLIVQHADSDFSFQKDTLLLMQEVASRDPSEVYLPGVALLTDRVRLAEGRKQLFGTQVVINPQTKELVVFPVEDPDNLEKRRSKYGLSTMEEYLKKIKELYKLS